MISFAPLTTALTGIQLTDDEVDRKYGCEHRFVGMPHAEGFGMCSVCGLVLWIVVELVYCDWRGVQAEGHV